MSSPSVLSTTLAALVAFGIFLSVKIKEEAKAQEERISRLLSNYPIQEETQELLYSDNTNEDQEKMIGQDRFKGLIHEYEKILKRNDPWFFEDEERDASLESWLAQGNNRMSTRREMAFLQAHQANIKSKSFK